MVSNLAGDQWNEGMFRSVVRRVALPDAFLIDGLFDTFLTVLNQMEVFPAVIDAERDRYLPFLLTTTIMMEAVKAGAERGCPLGDQGTCGGHRPRSPGREN